MAFYSVLSFGPLLLLVLVAAAHIWNIESARQRITAQMAGFIGPEGAESVQSILTTASANKHGGVVATILGTLMLVFSASGAFGELRDAMNVIWRVSPRMGRPILHIVRERSLSFFMALAAAFLLLAALLLSAALAVVSGALNALPVVAALMPAVNFLFNLALTVALFGLLFKTMPDTQVMWTSVWPGATLAGSLFVLGKMLIGLYLRHTGIATSYGAAGSVVVILIWVYYSAQIFFFGAEFAAVYGRGRRACKNR